MSATELFSLYRQAELTNLTNMGFALLQIVGGNPDIQIPPFTPLVAVDRGAVGNQMLLLPDLALYQGVRGGIAIILTHMNDGGVAGQLGVRPAATDFINNNAAGQPFAFAGDPLPSKQFTIIGVPETLSWVVGN